MEKAVIDEVALNNHLEKLVCLTDILQENMMELNQKFNNITNYYKTDNTNKILELNSIEEMNLKTINKDAEKYINIINHTITKYKQTEQKVSSMFENLS